MTNKVLKEIKKAFFRTKYRNGYKIVKILFLSFRFKSNHIPKTKLESHIPTKFEVVGRHTYCGKDLVVESPLLCRFIGCTWYFVCLCCHAFS